MSTTPIDLPFYVRGINDDNYQEEFNQTLREWLSSNGWEMPQITAANLAIIAPQMPDGTFWYVTDATPPGPVMNSRGAIVRILTGVYP